MMMIVTMMITNLFQVEPNTVCQLGSKSKEFNDTKLTAKRFEEQECSQGRKEIPHRKMLPECRNVTKQNCVTLWETDDAGKKYFLCLNIFQKKDYLFIILRFQVTNSGQAQTRVSQLPGRSVNWFPRR